MGDYYSAAHFTVPDMKVGGSFRDNRLRVCAALLLDITMVEYIKFRLHEGPRGSRDHGVRRAELEQGARGNICPIPIDRGKL